MLWFLDELRALKQLTYLNLGNNNLKEKGFRLNTLIIEIYCREIKNPSFYDFTVNSMRHLNVFINSPRTVLTVSKVLSTLTQL